MTDTIALTAMVKSAGIGGKGMVFTTGEKFITDDWPAMLEMFGNFWGLYTNGKIPLIRKPCLIEVPFEEREEGFIELNTFEEDQHIVAQLSIEDWERTGFTLGSNRQFGAMSNWDLVCMETRDITAETVPMSFEDEVHLARNYPAWLTEQVLAKHRQDKEQLIQKLSEQRHTAAQERASEHWKETGGRP